MTGKLALRCARHVCTSSPMLVSSYPAICLRKELIPIFSCIQNQLGRTTTSSMMGIFCRRYLTNNTIYRRGRSDTKFFQPKRAVILNKVTRYEYEKILCGSDIEDDLMNWVSWYVCVLYSVEKYICLFFCRKRADYFLKKIWKYDQSSFMSHSFLKVNQKKVKKKKKSVFLKLKIK